MTLTAVSLGLKMKYKRIILFTCKYTGTFKENVQRLFPISIVSLTVSLTMLELVL